MNATLTCQDSMNAASLEMDGRVLPIGLNGARGALSSCESRKARRDRRYGWMGAGLLPGSTGLSWEKMRRIERPGQDSSIRHRTKKAGLPSEKTARTAFAVPPCEAQRLCCPNYSGQDHEHEGRQGIWKRLAKTKRAPGRSVLP